MELIVLPDKYVAREREATTAVRGGKSGQLTINKITTPSGLVELA